MDKLAEARRRYPLGTTFISAYSGNRFTVDRENYHTDYSGDICADQGIVWLNNEDRWAEIVGKVSAKSNNGEMEAVVINFKSPAIKQILVVYQP